MLLTPAPAEAGGLFDFFFGAFNKPPGTATQPSNYGEGSSDPLGPPGSAPAGARVAASGPAFCVRSCDGKYFPLMRGLASPAQMCQAFCPATPTKVYFGASIDGAYAATGERYADSENAFAYRKALRADCTCNARGPAGLAPVDLALDPSLRAGDVVATSDGLVAYSGTRAGNNQQAEFTPIASYPGLTAEVRARLADIKVAPRAEKVGNAAGPNTPSEVTGSVAEKASTVRSGKRAAAE